jgi:hypothetical protein
MDADLKKSSNSKKTITLSGPNKTLNHQKSAPTITRPKSGSNKENTNPNEVESPLNDNGNSTRKSPKYKKERKQKKIAREVSKNVIIPFTGENTDMKKKLSVEDIKKKTHL